MNSDASVKRSTVPVSDEPWVSVLVLTRNEEAHISRCVESAKKLTPHVFVVDSNSSDNTVAIATESGATVTSGDFNRFADKLNWSLEHIDFPTRWVFRLDADETLTDALVMGLRKVIKEAATEVSGVYVRRQLWFMGHWIKYGGMYPTFSMRLWKKGAASCESRDLDEHMIMHSGRCIHVDLDVIDNPLSDLSSWISKHNSYSSSEALTALNDGDGSTLIKPDLFGDFTARTRWFKVNIFYRLPLFVRPLLYFVYRYFLRLGFLDGKIGFVFHFLHGLWYRALVDAKIMELTQNNMKRKNETKIVARAS